MKQHTQPSKTTQRCRKAAPAPEPRSAPVRASPTGKMGLLMGLLSRPEGATVAQMSAATGWLPHSVRGAMSGALKKGLGVSITSDKQMHGRVYRVASK